MKHSLQSMLFVPGSRPDRFAKALASGADCVCIDLEDSVPDGGKAEARAVSLSALGDRRFALRINPLTTRDGLADLLALGGGVCPSLLFIPKVESAHEIHIAREVIGRADIGFVPLIESVKGLAAAAEIAHAPQVAMLMFGGADLAADLGVDMAWEPLLHARSSFVMACAGAGIGAIDVPYIQLDNPAGLVEEAARAKALGFTAKSAIHPSHIEVIHDIFRPTEDAIAEAFAARAAFEAAGGAAVKFNGRMLEAPMMRRFEQIIAIGDKPRE
jgi:(S)-citramalyl-CoA lyase